MRISKVAKLEKDLIGNRWRKRSIFPQVRCDAEFFALVKARKDKMKLTWEEALTDMGINWLKR